MQLAPRAALWISRALISLRSPLRIHTNFQHRSGEHGRSRLGDAAASGRSVHRGHTCALLLNFRIETAS
jgi:hypothetical protein